MFLSEKISVNHCYKMLEYSNCQLTSNKMRLQSKRYIMYIVKGQSNKNIVENIRSSEKEIRQETQGLEFG